MTRFEKRVLAGILSAVMCMSAFWTPTMPVHAEDVGVAAETTVEGNNASKESLDVPKDSLEMEQEKPADVVKPQETEEKTEPQEIVAETEAKDAAVSAGAESAAANAEVIDVVPGEYEAVIAEAGQKVEYRFVPEETDFYHIWVDGSSDGSCPGYEIEPLGERGYYKDGVEDDLVLLEGQEYILSISYSEDSEPSTGTISWGFQKMNAPYKSTETIYSETGETKELFYRLVAPDSGEYQAFASEHVPYIDVTLYDEKGRYSGDNTELEGGKVYFIRIFVSDDRDGDNPFQWSVSKTENVNAETGQTYQKEKGKSLEYQFTPAESGRYQIQFKKDMESDTGSSAAFWDGNYFSNVKETKAFTLEKGKTCELICDLWDKATVRFQPVTFSELELGKEYTLTSDAMAYTFIPQETNTYVTQGGNVSIWNENWEEENKMKGMDGNDRVMLKAGQTYYFEFYETEGKRKVEPDKKIGEYSYLIKEDGTVQILKYLGEGGVVTMPDTIEGKKIDSMGQDVFYGTDVTEVTISDSVTKVGTGTFKHCKSLEKVTLGRGMDTISGAMFQYCSSLKEVVFPKDMTGRTGITKIEYAAFWDCSSLENLEFPDSLRSIEDSLAFYACKWYDNQPDGVVYANKVLYDYKGEMPENTKITVKEGTVSIVNDAFVNYAFNGQENLKSITIPKSVETIGERAVGFYYDSSNGGYVKIEDFVIYGVPRSEAERYAQENGFEFIPTVSYVKGDVTEDGEIDIRDLRLVLRSVCQKMELTERQSLAADVTEDSVVDIRDLRKVLRYVCHKITEL